MIKDLLLELDQKGIQLTYSNGKIKYFGPESFITPDLLEKIKNNKEKLINYLCSDGSEAFNSQNNGELMDKVIVDKQAFSTSQFNNFEQFNYYLKSHGYSFTIKNARLFCNSETKKNNSEIENAIAKHYENLYLLNWPMANTNLTPIQTQGKIDPFFIIHGEQSIPFLKDNFGSEIPLFDFFHQSSDGMRMKHKKVEEIADFYLSQLLKIKEDGQFLLGGYSFGGLVAYEMAQKLIKQGKSVNLLVLIDTHVPGFDGYNYVFQNFFHKIKYFVLSPVNKQVNSLVKVFYCNLFLWSGKHIPLKLRNFYIIKNYSRNYSKYKPQNYSGNLHLITANRFFKAKDSYLGWKKFVNGNIEVTSLPGNHKDMVKNPLVAKMLASKIKDYIKEVLN